MADVLDLLAKLALEPDREFANLISAAERALQDFSGFGHVSLNASGLVSLQAALHAAGVGPGCEVVCDVMFPFGVLAALQLGATPVAADISRDTLTMDAASLADAVNSKTRAVVATASYGVLPCTQNLRQALVGRTDLILVEDHAQAFTARSGKDVSGAPDVVCMSFQTGKLLSVGHGGAVACNRVDLDSAVRRYVSLGWYPRYTQRGQIDWEGSWRERISTCLSARLPPIAAGLLLGRLEHMRARHATHVDNLWALLDRLSASLKDVSIQAYPSLARVHRWRVALVAAGEREAAHTQARLAAVGSHAYRPNYPPVPQWPCFQPCGMRLPPNTSDLLGRLVLLPVADEAELDRELRAVSELKC